MKFKSLLHFFSLFLIISVCVADPIDTESHDIYDLWVEGFAGIIKDFGKGVLRHEIADADYMKERMRNDILEVLHGEKHIDQDEFLIFLKKVAPPTLDPLDICKTVDKNEDGFFDANELQEFADNVAYKTIEVLKQEYARREDEL